MIRISFGLSLLATPVIWEAIRSASSDWISAGEPPKWHPLKVHLGVKISALNWVRVMVSVVACRRHPHRAAHHPAPECFHLPNSRTTGRRAHEIIRMYVRRIISRLGFSFFGQRVEPEPAIVMAPESSRAWGRGDGCWLRIVAEWR